MAEDHSESGWWVRDPPVPSSRFAGSPAVPGHQLRQLAARPQQSKCEALPRGAEELVESVIVVDHSHGHGDGVLHRAARRDEHAREPHHRDEGGGQRFDAVPDRQAEIRGRAMPDISGREMQLNGAEKALRPSLFVGGKSRDRMIEAAEQGFLRNRFFILLAVTSYLVILD